MTAVIDKTEHARPVPQQAQPGVRQTARDRRARVRAELATWWSGVRKAPLTPVEKAPLPVVPVRAAADDERAAQHAVLVAIEAAMARERLRPETAELAAPPTADAAHADSRDALISRLLVGILPDAGWIDTFEIADRPSFCRAWERRYNLAREALDASGAATAKRLLRAGHGVPEGDLLAVQIRWADGDRVALVDLRRRDVLAVVDDPDVHLDGLTSA